MTWCLMFYVKISDSVVFYTEDQQDTALWKWQMKRVLTAVYTDSTGNWYLVRIQ